MAVFFYVHFGHSVFCGSGQPCKKLALILLHHPRRSCTLRFATLGTGVGYNDGIR